MPVDAATVTRGTRALRSAVAVLVAVAAVGGLGLAQATSAEATSYRFWTYWTGGTAWTFATVGASRVPADGSVEGWRFAVSAASSSASPPRTASGFASICGSTPPVAGSKRVALIVDFGTAADAPPGDSPPDEVVTHCAVVPTSANGYAVLDDLTSMRVESGLVCGIGGYPARGCGEVVSDPPTDESSGGGSQGGGSGVGSPSSGGQNGSQSTSAGAGADAGRTGEAEPSVTKSPGTGGGRSDDGGPPDTSASPSGEAVVDPSDDTSPVAAGVAGNPEAASAGSPVGAMVGIVAVMALGITAWLVSRRRRAMP